MSSSLSVYSVEPTVDSIDTFLATIPQVMQSSDCCLAGISFKNITDNRTKINIRIPALTRENGSSKNWWCARGELNPILCIR